VRIGSGTTVYSLKDFVVLGAGPYISGFSPPAGSAGTRVYIDGANFTGVTNAYFDGKRGNNFFVQGDGRIQVDAPANVTTGKITVRAPLGNSTSAAYFYVPPVITGFTPPRGRSGTNVVITGTNFIDTTAVTFGGTNAEFTVLSNLAIRAVVPPLARSGVIRVFTPADSYLTSSNFVVLPTIYGFSPGTGMAGTPVVITGANFTNRTAGSTIIRFNGVQASISELEWGRVKAVVPASATTGPISITTSEGSHTNETLFYVAPTLTSFTPTNSPPGSVVRITGNNLTGATAVDFAGVPAASFVVSNNTTIGATVPVGVSTGPIRVTTPAGTASSTALFYGPALITGFTPTHGLPGTNVFITGTNFIGTTAVRFGAVNATWFAATNNGYIHATVPLGAQDGPISVVTPAGTNTTAMNFNLDYVNLVAGITYSPDFLFTGSNSTWVVSVTNYGPADSPNTRLTNTLPYGTFVVSAVSSQGTLVTNTGSVVASLGTLPAGASAHVTQTLRFPSAGSIFMTADAVSGYWETVPANNTTNVNAFVHPPALLNVQLIDTNRVRVSWPLSLSNLVLQHKFTVDPTNAWLNNVTPRLTTSTENVVTETNNAPRKFYRLQSP
jgi:large repetitive protein